MQLTSLLLTIAAVAGFAVAAPAAAADDTSYPPSYDPPSYPAPAPKPKTPVCASGETALCCQLDVLGVVDASCEC